MKSYWNQNCNQNIKVLQLESKLLPNSKFFRHAQAIFREHINSTPLHTAAEGVYILQRLSDIDKYKKMLFDEIFAKLVSIISDVTDIRPEYITIDSSIKNNLCIDSMEYYEIFMQIEEIFKIEVPNNALNNFQYVREIVNFLEDNL